MSLSIDLSIFVSRLSAICEEMGAALRRSAFSPNIKDRLDYSCAIFDRTGQLSAQAAHIPVHLGSMAFAMADVVGAQQWQPGDVLLLNDPYLGGTHLPDVTVVSPVFCAGTLVAFVANRAHHANIGASSPGSMPIAESLYDEGAVIGPTLVERGGALNKQVIFELSGNRDDPKAQGDFYAQISACKLGAQRLAALVESMEVDRYEQLLDALNDYASELAAQFWGEIPSGSFTASDAMEDDGLGNKDIKIKLKLSVDSDQILADFSGTDGQTAGNINCPLSVTAAAVYYAFVCLLPRYAPACAGLFRRITIKVEQGSLLNALRPAAVAAGNVETSSRIVDVVLAALAQAMPERIPAASQGTMNNIAMGAEAQRYKAGELATPAWDYYETLAGGGGAGHLGCGLSARQTHMTNTLNTPVESIESHYPLRIKSYRIRQGSGGQGEFSGGEGVVREFEFLSAAQATLLTERRVKAPPGLHGAQSGKCGENRLNGDLLPAKTSIQLKAGDVLSIATPGGGGWNKALV